MMVTIYRLIVPNGYVEFISEQAALEYAAFLGTQNPEIQQLPREIE